MQSLGTSGRLIAAAAVIVVVLVAGAVAALALSGGGTDPHIVAQRAVAVKVTTSAPPPVTQTVTTRTVTVQAAPAPTTSPATTVPPSSGPIRRFTTGRDAGQATVATVCRVADAVLDRWTPNDGFTVELPRSGTASRVRADEPFNRGRQPSYPAIGFGAGWRSGGFACVSRTSGLTCSNADGHGWTLPRYRGLPAYF